MTKQGKNDIEWCDYTWNPITGCLHDCKYCYAKNQARRFKGFYSHPLGANCIGDEYTPPLIKERVLDAPLDYKTKSGKIIKASYPFGFAPTLHHYRLTEPQEIKTPQNIFVGSMADGFGSWLPPDWVTAVFEACKAAPQHRYIFLTKDPHAYCDHDVPTGERYWYGQTQDGQQMLTGYRAQDINTFLSIEPLGADPGNIPFEWFDWVIVGAEKSNRKNKMIPRREWLETIVRECDRRRIPLFVKNNIAPLWEMTYGLPLRREYPWEVTV